MNFCLHGSARTVREAVERARRAERARLRSEFFFADSQMGNVDPYQVMAMCAVQTKNIRFGTAVTNMVYRDPTITANSFATLNEISQGRAINRLRHRRWTGLQLGTNSNELDDFEKGLAHDSRFVHDRGIDVPEAKNAQEAMYSLKSRQAPVPIYNSAEDSNASSSPDAPRRRYPRPAFDKQVTGLATSAHSTRAQTDAAAGLEGNRHHARRYDRRRRRCDLARQRWLRTGPSPVPKPMMARPCEISFSVAKEFAVIVGSR